MRRRAGQETGSLIVDVAIVGAGPAGAPAALAALHADPALKVLLLDRSDFPRDKSCGDGIAPHCFEKLASIGVHVARWVTTHGYALNVDLDTGPFTAWITACGLEDAHFTTISAELGRPVTVDEVKPAAIEALGEVFGLVFEGLPAEHGAGLWAQPVHARLAGR